MQRFPARAAILCAALPLTLASTARADAPPPTAPAPPPNAVEVGGKVFLDWHMDLSEGADHANAFDLTRAYLFAKARLGDHVRARVTLDAPSREPSVKVGSDGATTVTSNAGRFAVVLKHAYVELADVLTKGLGVKLGMHDLPWIPFEEKAYGYRFVGPLMLDREGYLSSADLGLGLTYDLPAKWLSLGLALVDGETWSKPEVSAHKDVQLRATVTPLTTDAGALRVSAFLSYGEYDEGNDSTRLRALGQLAWEGKDFTAAALFAVGTDRASALAGKQPSLAAVSGLAHMQGLSAYAWLDAGAFGVADGLRLLGRFDWLDPDTDTDDNSHTRETVGLGYRLNDKFQCLLDLELTQYDKNAGPSDETRLALHTELSF